MGGSKGPSICIISFRVQALARVSFLSRPLSTRPELFRVVL